MHGAGAVRPHRRFARKNHSLIIRKFRVIDVGNFLQQTHHLARVSKLVVVPHVQVDTISACDSRIGVNDGSVAIADKVRAHAFGVDRNFELMLERSGLRLVAKVVVELLFGHVALQLQHQDSHRHVGRRDPDGIRSELAFKRGNALDDGAASASLSQHHIEGRSASSTGLFVKIIDQVLIIGVRVHGLSGR